MEALDLAIGTLDLQLGRLRLQDGEQRELSAQECALLEYLAERPHQDVSREDLLSEVLGYARGAVTRAVDDAMKRLRAKVERVPSRPFHLVAVRGVGYRFVPLQEAPSARRFALGERVVDLDRLVVEGPDGPPVTLSDHEGRLLEVLRARDGRPMPTLDLLREVWGIRDPGQRRVVDKLVYRLRGKIEDGRSHRFLQTIRGRGLALVVDEPTPLRAVHPGVPCPPPDGPVIGRDLLIEDVLAAVDDPGALVTLHGPAGAGKSTVARAVAQAWPGDVAYADLEPHRTADAIRSALARAVGADAAPEEPSGRLHDALRVGDDVLVVLDHAEVALQPLTDVLLEIRDAVPRLRLLVTSRHPLAVPGEHIVPVDPLPEDAAIELFVTRASAAGVSLDPRDERLRNIVDEVDRIPLALDLAAGRLRLLGVDGLVARLDRPLQLLGDVGAHDGLRQSIVRTWEALGPVDRTCLAICSRLPGPFSADAAEHVGGAVIDGSALEPLQRLVDFAVLRRTPQGRLAPFLGVSELVSELMQDELAALEPRIRLAHLEWLASLAELSRPFWGPAPEQVATLALEVPGALAVLSRPAPPDHGALHARILVWLAPVLSLQGQSRQARALLRRLGALDLDPDLHAQLELARFRAAHRASREEADAVARQLASHVRAHGLSEIEGVLLGEWIRVAADAGEDGRTVSPLERLEALLDDLPTPMAEAHLRSARGWVRFRRGDLDEAWSELQESLTLARMARAPWLVSRTCYNLAGVCRFEGRLAEAEAFLEQSRVAYEQARIPYSSSDPDDMLGLIRVEQGRFAEARALHEGILQRSRRAGQRAGSALQANRLGTIAGYLGDTGAAIRWFEEARAGFVALGERARAEGARYNLGEIALQSGRLDDAEAAFRDALAGFREMGREVHAGVCLGGLGRVALARGDDAAAEPLLAEALGIVEAGRARRQAAELRACLAQARIADDPAGASSLARAAVDVLGSLGSTPTLGAAWCRYGLARAAAGDLAAARDALGRARALMEELSVASGGELQALVDRLAEAAPPSP